MSSADSRPPEKTNSLSDSQADASAAADSNRPALKKPPRRPARPTPVEEEPTAVAQPVVSEAAPVKAEPQPVATSAPLEVVELKTQQEVEQETEQETEDASEASVPQPRLQPIAPPSEPMQYRAIGLLKGKYEPSEESFNRGAITNHDGSVTAAVLLGRTTSLVKKHLDLEKEHLWVVYPRTIFQDDIGIAVQIVGVWEPETLSEEEDDTLEPPTDAIQPDYFSIRGEVVKYDERKQEITISIVQKMRTGKQPKRPFKLVINGSIGVKTIGYFWDMDVHREGNQFVLTEGHYVAAVPPKKRSKKRIGGGPGGGGKRRPSFKRSAPPRPKTHGDKPVVKGEVNKDEPKTSVVQIADSGSAPAVPESTGD
ncbi:MAG: hypothetical protein AAF959_04330 [Cyanobacteria bacterium P01_D01_bin.56]